MELSYEDARTYIIEHPENILQKAKKSGYVCPCCGSGNGAHGTGIQESKQKPGYFTCWAGDCFHSASVIDIVAKSQNLSAREAFFYCLDANHITLTHSQHEAKEMKPLSVPKRKEQPEPPKVSVAVIQADIRESHEYSPQKYDYLMSRGISRMVQEHFGVGYIERWKTPSVRNLKRPDGKPLVYGAPYCIIPTNKEGTSYLARDTRDPDTLSDKQKDFVKMKVGNCHQFHWDCLDHAKDAVFVTEGEIDAMSVYQAGQVQALAIGSTAYINKFVSYLEEKAHLPIAFGVLLDRDDAGRNASHKLIEKLSGLGYHAADVSDILLNAKDANDALLNDPKRFSATLRLKANLLQRVERSACR